MRVKSITKSVVLMMACITLTPLAVFFAAGSEVVEAGVFPLFVARIDYDAGDSATSVALGDLDGDGDLDLVVANEGSDNVSVLKNKGKGAFAAKVDYGAGSGANSVGIGDLDGDGDLDLAVAGGNVSVLKNRSPH